MSGPPSLPSGWFPDPHGRFDHRWFNGTSWTADVSNDGQRFVDPDGAAPIGRSPAGAPQGNGIATASITCGLLAMLFAWMPVFVVIALVLAVLAIVFGIKGLRRSRRIGRGRGLATTGLVTGGAAIALSVVGIVWSVRMINEVVDFIEPGPVTADVTSCTIADGDIVIEGTVTNDSSRTRGYTVYGVVEVPDGVADLMTEIAELESGDSTEVVLRHALSSTVDDCQARLVVQGPLPYGLEMDRVND